MTRKDYKLFAAIFRQQAEGTLSDAMTVAQIVNAFVAELKADNPRFDAGRFKEAAGYELLLDRIAADSVTSPISGRIACDNALLHK